MITDFQLLKNGLRLSSGVFAGVPLTEQEEMQNLADALYNGETMNVDSNGVIHIDGDTEVGDNGTTISNGTFAGVPLTEQEEMQNLADALYNGETMNVDSNGVIHIDGDTEVGDNGTTISNGTFAVDVIPSNPDQWYNKNRALFRTEVLTMRQAHPDASFGFFKETGNMYWTIKMKISQTGFANEWTFVLIYDKDHPHNRDYGGSIKVFPIKPSMEDLKRMASEHNRPGVPHLIRHETHGTYLCTRRTEDVADGTTAVSSARQVAAWAADWAIHFEVGIRDKRVWNQWCDDAHFRKLMI